MKKLNLHLVLILTLSLFIVSCSKDDDNTNNNENPSTSGELLGTWKASTLNYTGKTTTTFGTDKSVTDYVGVGYDLDFTMTFSKDPNKLVSEGTYNLRLTTTVSGSGTPPITNEQERLKPITGAVWSKEGDQLTLIIDGETPHIGTILELTATTLKFSATQLKDISQPGYTSNTTETRVYVLTRK